MKGKLVVLLDPKMCTYCRFSSVGTILNEEEKEEVVVFCRRKDCDNWNTTTSLQVELQ